MNKNERRLRRMFSKWIKVFGLENWDISFELVPSDVTGIVDGLDIAADCLAHWEYERAVIRFTEPLEDDAALETHVVHELQHVLLNELRREHRMQNEERTAVVLTRAFMRMEKAA